MTEEKEKKHFNRKKVRKEVVFFILFGVLIGYLYYQKRLDGGLLIKGGPVTGGQIITTYTDKGDTIENFAYYRYEVGGKKYTDSAAISSKESRRISVADYYEVLYDTSDPIINRIDFLKPMVRLRFYEGISYNHVTHPGAFSYKYITHPEYYNPKGIDNLLGKEGIVTIGIIVQTFYANYEEKYGKYVYKVDGVEYTGSTLLSKEEEKVASIDGYYEVIYDPSDPTIKRIDFFKPMEIVFVDGDIYYEYLTYEE